jgi:hypothetical protein
MVRATLEDLKEQYPDRNIRKVRDYYAATRLDARTRPLTANEIAIGLAETLIADSVEDLAEQLAEQARRIEAFAGSAT